MVTATLSQLCNHPPRGFAAPASSVIGYLSRAGHLDGWGHEALVGHHASWACLLEPGGSMAAHGLGGVVPESRIVRHDLDVELVGGSKLEHFDPGGTGR